MGRTFFRARSDGHFTNACSELRAAFDRQGAQDWDKFRSLRACDLRLGGRDLAMRWIVGKKRRQMLLERLKAAKNRPRPSYGIQFSREQ